MSEATGEVAIPLTAVLDIAFLGGRATYLSDLEPSLVKEELGAAFRKKMPYRRDASVLGEPMRMAGREYRKGLGVHSYSRLEFDLGGRFSRFQAVAGLDESAQPLEPEALRAEAGQVVFRIALDGKTLLEKTLSWRDSPAAIELPVSGGKVLALEVDYGGPAGGFNFALDRANWAEARLLK